MIPCIQVYYPIKGARMKLAGTVDGMLSKDYKEQFKAEYNQLIIRMNSLKHMLDEKRNGTLDFEPTCPDRLLDEQFNLMTKLMYVYQERAACENIKL